MPPAPRNAAKDAAAVALTNLFLSSMRWRVPVFFFALFPVSFLFCFAFFWMCSSFFFLSAFLSLFLLWQQV